MQSANEINDYIRSKAASDAAFRSRLLASPKSVIEEELSIDIPDFYEIKVLEDGPTTAHLVLPPAAMLTEAELKAAQGGWTNSNCSNPTTCPDH